MKEYESDIKPDEILVQKKNELIKRRNRIESNVGVVRYSAVLVIILLSIASLISVYVLEKPPQVIVFFFAIGALYFLGLIFTPVMSNKNRIEDQIIEIENEMDLQNIGVESLEKRAEKQFRIHQNQLKRYYDLSLNQSRWIFLVGLICILAGMGIIITTLVFLFISNNNEVIISVTGGVAGILTNFIGVIFLKMYSETVKSLSTFHERLVTTHHLHFSNFLISKIFDEPLRNEAWAKLALSLSKESNEISLDNVRTKEENTD